MLKRNEEKRLYRHYHSRFAGKSGIIVFSGEPEMKLHMVKLIIKFGSMRIKLTLIILLALAAVAFILEMPANNSGYLYNPHPPLQASGSNNNIIDSSLTE